MSALGTAHLYVLAAVVMTALGQVMLKLASTSATSTAKIFLSWKLIVGYALLGGNVLMTLQALTSMTLSEFSVWVTLQFPLTIGLSVLLLEEKVGRRELLGLAVLVAGMVVFGTASQT